MLIKTIYSKHLKNINGINFTPREIDILSCLIYNKREKQIASILLISHKTVDSHISNIRLKISLSSRDQIINFLKRSNKMDYLKEWYVDILQNLYFAQTLQTIKRVLCARKYSCDIIDQVHIDNNKDFIKRVKSDLENCGITINNTSDTDENDSSRMNILIKSTEENGTISFEILISNKVLKDAKIYFSEDQKYIDMFLDMISQLVTPELLKEILKDHHTKVKTIAVNLNNKSNNREPFIIYRKSKYLLVTMSVLAIFMASYYIIIYTTKKLSNYKESLVSQISPSPNDYFIERTSITEKMNKLLSPPDSINTIALVGMAGSGKTFLARNYANTQKSSIVWEVNAKTPETIIDSIECLSYSLCTSDEEKTELHRVRAISNPLKRICMLRIFLSKKIQKHPNWIIIYDNIRSFKDTILYLPHNISSWGPGKVILITRNSNIINSGHLKEDHVLYVPELQDEEKMTLFTQVIGKNKIIESKLKEFLYKIPPYPMDILQAGFYIKNTNMSYEEYLRNATNNTEDFSELQQLLLGINGEYTKNRNKMINLSLKHIIKINPAFKDLLLLISVLNNSNIPKNLLVALKGEALTNLFINELRKFSLLSEQDNNTNIVTNENTFSFNSTIHYIIENNIKKDATVEMYQNMGLHIVKYIEEILKSHTDPRQLHLYIKHIESLLSEHFLFDNNILFYLNTLLGNYYYISNYDTPKALHTLEYARTINISKNINTELWVAKNKCFFANIQRDLGKYKEAEKHLLEVYKVFKSHHPDKTTNVEMCWVLKSLARNYLLMKNHKEAEKLYLKAIEFLKKESPPKDADISWILIWLGQNYIYMGNLAKAEELLIPNADILINRYGSKHSRAGWAHLGLSELYFKKKQYKEAKDNLNKAQEIFKNVYSRNNFALDCVEKLIYKMKGL